MTHYDRILALQRALADAVQEAQNWRDDYSEMHARAVGYVLALEEIMSLAESGEPYATRVIEQLARQALSHVP